MRVHRNILPRCWVIQAEQEKGGKDMTLPEQERERFCQVLYHSRTSLYRLAFSITRNSSDAQEAVAEAVCRAYERYPQLREKEKLPRWLLKITANEARRLCQRRGRTVSWDDLPTEPARQYRAGRRGTIPFGRRADLATRPAGGGGAVLL